MRCSGASLINLLNKNTCISFSSMQRNTSSWPVTSWSDGISLAFFIRVWGFEYCRRQDECASVFNYIKKKVLGEYFSATKNNITILPSIFGQLYWQNWNISSTVLGWLRGFEIL